MIDNFNKEEVLLKLDQLYDQWKYKEQKNISKGLGMRGVRFDTTTDVDVLFNQLMWSI